MRFAVAIALTTVFISLSSFDACGGRNTGDSASLATLATSDSAGVSETPLPASLFNDSVGVALHLPYRATAWDTDYARWSPILLASPIKHVRDSFCDGGAADSFCTGAWLPRWKNVAAAGITIDVITNPGMGWDSACNGTCFRDYTAQLGIDPTSIDAYEGPNECDEPDHCKAYGVRSTSAAITVGSWTPLLWTLRSPGTAIYGPAMAFPRGYAKFGTLSQYMDFGSIHDYPGDSYPENNVVPSWRAGAAAMSGPLPLVSTESGYNTDPTFSNHGVSQLAQERYLPRILFTHLSYGIKRTYLYELFDYPPEAGQGQDFGLLNADYSPKPAWTRLIQLMRYFQDAGTSQPSPLAYGMSGDGSGTLHHVLFQRSDRTYLLVLWLGTSLWDSASHTDTEPRSEDVTITLPKVPASAVFTQFKDRGQMRTDPVNRPGQTVRVDVTSLVSVLSFRF
ncbi:MAG TPA: hypothetical protein VMA36_21070 [Candidatus Limnocylindria bacterium]|nr:hypothetical protein [Candidatus Limnocylindria bacterium]